MKIQTYLYLIYLVKNVVFITRCLVKAVQDDISAKFVPIWLHQTSNCTINNSESVCGERKASLYPAASSDLNSLKEETGSSGRGSLEDEDLHTYRPKIPLRSVDLHTYRTKIPFRSVDLYPYRPKIPLRLVDLHTYGPKYLSGQWTYTHTDLNTFQVSGPLHIQT